MMTYSTIVVGFRPNTTRDLFLKTEDDPSFQALQTILNKYGIVYRNEDWDTPDPESASYLYLQLSSELPLSTVIEELLLCEFVESAYIKPMDVLPQDDFQF